MEWLQNLIDQSTVPALTALLLGLFCSLSPCPLATNIVAIGFIGRDISHRRRVFARGLLYTLGRVLSYTVLGVVLIYSIRRGIDTFGIQEWIAGYGSVAVGPVLVCIGIYMLCNEYLGFGKISLGFGGEWLANKGNAGALLLGMLFALAFCPTSGVLYFGMLVPISVSSPDGYLLPLIFALGTSLPVILVAWLLSYSAHRVGEVYGKIKSLQKWMTLLVGLAFIIVGAYYIGIIAVR